MARNNPITRNSKFSGLRDAVLAQQVGFEALAVADNVDIDRDLQIRRRPGYAQVYAGDIVSVWGDKQDLFFTSGGQFFHLLDGTGNVDDLGSVVASDHLHGVRTTKGVVLTTNQEVFVYQKNGALRTIGLDPLDPPSVTVNEGGGVLRAGRIMLATTAFDTVAGESGSSELVMVDVPEGSSISVQLPSSTYTVYLYASTPNGIELFRIGKGDGGDTVEHRGHTDRTMQFMLRTIGHGVPARNQIRTVAEYNGRLLYAEGDVLWYSEPLFYERFALDEGYIMLDSAINLLAPVRDGVFVGTQEAHFFFGGSDISRSEVNSLLGYGAALTQPTYVQPHEHNFENVTTQVPMWLSRKGMVAGFDGGSLINVSEGTVQFQDARVATLAMRRSSGLNQAIACVRY